MPEVAQQFIRDDLQRFRFPWYWFGNPGCGKTCAALAIYLSAPGEIESKDGGMVPCTPVAMRLDELVTHIKAARRHGTTAFEKECGQTVQRTERLIWSVFKRASIVVIDDVGTQQPRPGSPEEAIIDKAADVLQHCRVILTSNIKPVKEDDDDHEACLASVYDDRVASRLLANGVARHWASESLRNKELAIHWQE